MHGSKLRAMRSPLPMLCLLLAACGGKPFGPPMPTALAPVAAETVVPWVQATRVIAPIQMRFRFSYLEEGASAKGRGTAIVLPPDSLRFDFAGPLGSGRSAAAVIGDSGLWAVPEDEVEKLVPNYPILWAMLGQARGPAAGDRVRAFADTTVTAWRYTAGADTVDYIRTAGASGVLVVDVRQSGRRIGRVVTHLDARGRPLRSRLEVPSKPARVELEFYRWEAPDSLPPNLWVKPDAES